MKNKKKNPNGIFWKVLGETKVPSKKDYHRKKERAENKVKHW